MAMSMGGPFSFSMFEINQAPAGTYTIEDIVTGAQGTSYATLSAFATAIPEPATWVVMFAGFGAIGASMRSARRKQSLAARLNRLKS